MNTFQDPHAFAAAGTQTLDDRKQAASTAIGANAARNETAGNPDPQWENRKVRGALEEVLTGAQHGAPFPVSLRMATSVIYDLAVTLRQDVAALNEALAPVSATAPFVRPILMEGKVDPQCPASADLMEAAGNLLDLYFTIGSIRSNLRIH